MIYFFIQILSFPFTLSFVCLFFNVVHHYSFTKFPVFLLTTFFKCSDLLHSVCNFSKFLNIVPNSLIITSPHPLTKGHLCLRLSILVQTEFCLAWDTALILGLPFNGLLCCFSCVLDLMLFSFLTLLSCAVAYPSVTF